MTNSQTIDEHNENRRKENIHKHIRLEICSFLYIHQEDILIGNDILNKNQDIQKQHTICRQYIVDSLLLLDSKLCDD
jgi:hypothetical protein